MVPQAPSKTTVAIFHYAFCPILPIKLLISATDISELFASCSAARTFYDFIGLEGSRTPSHMFLICHIFSSREMPCAGLLGGSMWKNKKSEEAKDSMVMQKEAQPIPTSSLAQPAPAPVGVVEKPIIEEARMDTKAQPRHEEVVNIGKSVYITGELTGDEDLTIEGRVEGKIELKDHNLVIGPHGKIQATIHAKTVTVIGSVVGNIQAREIVDIQASGSVVGDIQSARIAIADGAHFKGSLDVQGEAGVPKKPEMPRAESVTRIESAVMPRVEAKPGEVATLPGQQVSPPLDPTQPPPKARVA
jgi:cytoskeletal protein CcmA (bactofilin family)